MTNRSTLRYANEDAWGGLRYMSLRRFWDDAVQQGEKIGPYVTMALLGEGGGGRVYLARIPGEKQRVAIKKNNSPDQKEFLDLFRQEKDVLSSVQHKRLPRFYEYVEKEREQYIVIEYIEGKSLNELLKQGEITIKNVLEWGKQILEVLIYLHERIEPVIHRDIKPANIILHPMRGLVLLDFGICKIINAESQDRTTRPGLTPLYASTEQVQQNGTDHRTDIYSLGATLFHLVTQNKPIEAEKRIAEKKLGKPDPQRRARDINSEIPISLCEAIHRAMALNREDRFASAREMLLEIEKSSLSFEMEDDSVTLRRSTQIRDRFEIDISPCQKRKNWALTLILTIAAIALPLIGWQTIKYFPQQAPKEGIAIVPSQLPMTLSKKILTGTFIDEIGSPVTDIFLHRNYWLKLHPEESGYIYILAPDKEKNLILIFSNRGDKNLGPSGNEANYLKAGTNLIYPNLKNLYQSGFKFIGENTNLMIVFSPRPLFLPNFLKKDAPLMLDQKKQDDFHKASQNWSQGIVEISGAMYSLKASSFDKPLIFDIQVRAKTLK